MPKYTIRDENKVTKMIGEVEGSKPQALPPKRMDKNFQQISLTTNDIQGCAPGTGNKGNFHTRDRKDIREINVTKDIDGAQTNTVKKSPDTIRCTNPLQPDYQFPGRLELDNKNDAFGQTKNFKLTHASTFQQSAQRSLGI